MKLLLLLIAIALSTPADAGMVANWTGGHVAYQTFTWTGNGGNSNWSNGANWCGTVVGGVCQGSAAGPTSTDIAYFTNACVSNCTATLDVNVNLKGLTLDTTFSGTINQGAYTITVGTSGLTQLNGIINEGTGAFNVTSFTQNGGTFNANSGTLTATTGFSLGTSAVFNAGTGTVVWSNSTAGNFTPVNYSGTNFYNLQMVSNVSGANFSTSTILPFSGTATLNAVAAVAYFTGVDSNQSMLRPLNGSTVRTLGHGFSSFTNFGISGAGNFTLDVSGASSPLAPGLEEWNAITITAIGTPSINGIGSHSGMGLTLNGNIIDTGAFGIGANIAGTSQITVCPTYSTTFGVGGTNIGSGITMIINAPGATLTLTKTLSDSNTGASAFHVVAGTFNMNNWNFGVAGTVTIDSGATITRGTGTLSYGTLVNNGTLN